MARFQMELPTDVMKDLANILNDSDEIFGKMVEAGAEVVHLNLQGTIPNSMRDSEIMKCLKVTKVYKTPSDDGINCKVGFYGYFHNRDGKLVPAPLVINVFEYGRSDGSFPKHPFVRKAFKKSAIEKAMLQAQKEASGGILYE